MAKETVQEITIPAINLKKATIVLAGQTPLITNNFSEAKKADIEAKQQGKAESAAKKGNKIRDPQSEFLGSLYNVPGQPGKYGIPAIGIKKMLVVAGGRFTSEKMTTLRGAINILAPAGGILPLDGSEPEMRTDVVRLAGMGRPADLRYRAEFKQWRLKVPVVFNADVLSLEQVVNLFQIAGFSVGLGEWRPENNGIYGQFSVEGAE